MSDTLTADAFNWAPQHEVPLDFWCNSHEAWQHTGRCDDDCDVVAVHRTVMS